MNRTKMWLLTGHLSCFLICFLSFSLHGKDVERTAHDVWLDMTEGHLNYDPKPIIVDGFFDTPESDTPVKGRQVTFGGEKEGSSSLITHVMGPDKKEFANMLNTLEPEQQANFYRDFLNGMANGRYRETNIVSAAGVPQDLNYSSLSNVDFQNLSLNQLEDKVFGMA